MAEIEVEVVEVDSLEELLKRLITGGQCPRYGTPSGCCRDWHLSIEGVPEVALNALNLSEDSNTVCNQEKANVTVDRAEVSCYACKERISS